MTEIINVTEASKYLKVSERTVWLWIKDGFFPEPLRTEKINPKQTVRIWNREQLDEFRKVLVSRRKNKPGRPLSHYP